MMISTWADDLLFLVAAGEFEKHAGCWMGWPYDKYLWREDALPAKKQYAAVAKTISQFEPVTMWTDPSVVEDAKQYLTDAPNVTVKAMPINDGESLLPRRV
jgi:agmatine deiminase